MNDNSIAFPLSSVAPKSSLDKLSTIKESGISSGFQSVLDSYVTQSSDSTKQPIKNSLKTKADDSNEATENQHNDAIDNQENTLIEIDQSTKTTNAESSVTANKQQSDSAISEDQTALQTSDAVQQDSNKAVPGLVNIIAAQTFNNQLEQQEKTVTNSINTLQSNQSVTSNNSTTDSGNKLNKNSSATNSETFATQLASVIASDKKTTNQTNTETVSFFENNIETQSPEQLKLSHSIHNLETQLPYTGQTQTVNQSTSINTINQPLSNYQITSNFYSDNWNTAVHQQILLLRHNNIDNATLILNPEHLGPIHVSIQIDGQSQTSVQFWSQNPEVRQALKDALPDLNSLFQESGLQLGNADVSSQQNPSDNTDPQFKQFNRPSAEMLEDSSIENQINSSLSVKNLVNVYI